MSQFTKLLRTFGGIALISAAFVFLIQGYSGFSPFERFLSFFALLGLNAGAGMFCVYKLQDPKSGRLLLTLMTAGISVLFAQMGAMMYSLFHPTVEAVPKLLRFESLAPVDIGIALGMTAVCLIPSAVIAFQALMRPKARDLTVAYFGINALLLIPMRNVEAVSMMLFAGCALALWALYEGRKHLAHFSTIEGRVAHLLLFTPVVILLGRGYFYDNSVDLLATVALIFGVSIPILARLFEGKMNGFLETSTLLFTACGWQHWAENMGKFLHLSDWTTSYVFALPIVAMVMIYEARGMMSRSSVRFSMGFVTLMNLVLAFALPSIGTYLCILAMGGAIVLWGYERKDKMAFQLGCINGFYSLGGQIILGVQLIESWTWLSLALCGVAGIVAASLIEKNALNFRNRYQQLMANFE